MSFNETLRNMNGELKLSSNLFAKWSYFKLNTKLEIAERNVKKWQERVEAIKAEKQRRFFESNIYRESEL